MRKFFSSLCFVILGPLFAQMNPGEYNGTTTNQVRRSVQMMVTTSAAGVTATVFAPTQEPQTTATIKAESLANIQIPTVTVTMTWAQIKKAGSLSLPFTVTYYPNPALTGGYQGFLYIALVFNLNYLSASYFNYQAAPLLANSPSSLLFFSMQSGGATVNDWFETGVGIALSNSWTTNSLTQVANSFGVTTGTSANFVMTFPYANLLSLPLGQYWFALYGLMEPYTAPTINASYISTILSNAEAQILTRTSLISFMNSATNLTAMGAAIRNTNRTLLKNQITAIISANTAYLTSLEGTTGLSTSIQEAIASAKASLAAMTP